MSVHVGKAYRGGVRYPLGLIGLVLLGWFGCATPEEAPPELGPPAGWQATDGRWWREGIDTTVAFRRLDTLEEMGIASRAPVYAGGAALAGRPDLIRQQLAQAVRQSLVRLYRNQPAVIDSLFEQYVVPRIMKASVQGDPRELVEQYKREGYKVIRRHFLEPRAVRRLGEDIVVPYPDSLREKRVGGVVRMQVYIDASGEPAAVELLEGVHPVLDRIALRAVTEMRWQPAYLLRGGKSDPIPSWTRFNLTFSAPST
ncbi:energy transducer TonB [Rhodocaloribacter litoris]|uniref:energy transducer TonB n=1 Tax=Rhodocaloribacter litoris TaxID=2558931 RepID=UPI001422F7A6|nr:TonB family protein [Rhodocaloribacter litoris]QXD14946.1 energy transducer TonB [Rhodocaloribacter litoris]